MSMLLSRSLADIDERHRENIRPDNRSSREDQSRCAGRIPEAGAMENHVFTCNNATILQNLQNPQQSSFPARLPATVHEVGLAVRDYV